MKISLLVLGALSCTVFSARAMVAPPVFVPPDMAYVLDAFDSPGARVTSQVTRGLIVGGVGLFAASISEPGSLAQSTAIGMVAASFTYGFVGGVITGVWPHVNSNYLIAGASCLAFGTVCLWMNPDPVSTH